MRLNTKEGLTEMDKDGKMKNKIRNQMMDLNPIKGKQITKKLRSGKGKTTLDELLEQNQFIHVLERGNV